MRVDLDKLEALDSAAHEAPWDICANTSGFDLEDKELIDYVRSALPYMIAELKAARKCVDYLRTTYHMVNECRCVCKICIGRDKLIKEYDEATK